MSKRFAADGAQTTPLRLRLGVAAAIAALAGSPGAAVCATRTSVFAVSLSVQASCSVTTGAIAFGVYSGVLNTAVTTIGVTCTNTTTYNVGFDAGQTSGAGVSTRQMRYLSNTLPYSLYSNAAMTSNWGQTIGTDTVAGVGAGTAQTLMVYGRIAAGLRVTPGSYGDTVVVIVGY